MKKTADFATKKDFPEANTKLLAGDNPNTVDLDIFGNGEVVISKMLLDDEDIRKLTESRCLYLYYRSVTHPPVMVFVDSPWMSAEEMAAELAKDIATVTDRLRLANDLTYISKKTTHLEAMQINMRHGRDMFEGCEHLKQRMIEGVQKEINKE